MPVILLKWDSCFPVNIGIFLRTPILKKICIRLLLSDFSKWLFRTFFLESPFQNYPDLVILQKYQWLLNQAFKHNSVNMPSFSLTPMLSSEPGFLRMFIINGYNRKSKMLVVPGLLVTICRIQWGCLLFIFWS